MDTTPKETKQVEGKTRQFTIDGVSYDLAVPDEKAYQVWGKDYIDGVHGDDTRNFRVAGAAAAECNVFINSVDQKAAGLVVNPDAPGYSKNDHVEVLAPIVDRTNGRVTGYQWKDAVTSPSSKGDQRDTDWSAWSEQVPYKLDRESSLVYRVTYTTSPDPSPKYYHLRAQFPANTRSGDRRGEGDVSVMVAPVPPLSPTPARK